MRVLILGDVNSVHIQKWGTSLAERGIEIGIFSLSAAKLQWFENIENITICYEGPVSNSTFRGSILKKLEYLKVLPALKSTIKEYEPDIVHAHYASSYGLLGALTKFHPYFVSVWGSDVFDFPKENKLQKQILKSNLKKE